MLDLKVLQDRKGFADPKDHEEILEAKQEHYQALPVPRDLRVPWDFQGPLVPPERPVLL
jgi:hypothetical protein